jgi:hypothetical protein
MSFTIDPGPAQSFSIPSPAGLTTIFYWLTLETSPTWRARAPYLYVPIISPGHWVPFSLPPTTRREIFEPTSTRTLPWLQSQSQSQDYFMSDGLPPISSSWRQAPGDSRPVILFVQVNTCGHSPYVTSSLTRGFVCLLWICLAFRQVYISQIKNVIQNLSFCTTQKSYISTGFTEQIMPILRNLCYNGSLVAWKVVSLTTAKFKSLIFAVIQVKFKDMLRPTVSRPVYLGIKHPSGA